MKVEVEIDDEIIRGATEKRVRDMFQQNTVDYHGSVARKIINEQVDVALGALDLTPIIKDHIGNIARDVVIGELTESIRTIIRRKIKAAMRGGFDIELLSASQIRSLGEMVSKPTENAAEELK